MENARCARCGRTISPEEMEDGLVVETENGLYCSDCVTHIQGVDAPAPEAPEPVRDEEAFEQPAPPPPAETETPEAPDEDDPILLLRSILSELKPIRRAVLYEKASVWNVLGGIVQIFALGALLMLLVRWGEEGQSLLLLACFLQILALTFFVKGK